MSTVLVTGANRGLGYEFVKQYSKSNFNVLACCRSAENAYELQELSKGVKNIKIYELDVGNINIIKNLSRQLRNEKIDVLINNAGIYRSSTIGNINYKSIVVYAFYMIFRMWYLSNTFRPIVTPIIYTQQTYLKNIYMAMFNFCIFYILLLMSCLFLGT